MTPYERCIAANCCPIGLALYAKQYDFACKISIYHNEGDSFNPDIDEENREIPNMLKCHYFSLSNIIRFWDSEEIAKRIAAADWANDFGLI